AHAERRALAFSKVVAEQDEVDRVIELAAGVALELDPVEIARASLVFRVRSLDHDALQALADVVHQCPDEHLDRVGLDNRSGEEDGGAGDDLVDKPKPLLVGQLSKVAAV